MKVISLPSSGTGGTMGTPVLCQTRRSFSVQQQWDSLFPQRAATVLLVLGEQHTGEERLVWKERAVS